MEAEHKWTKGQRIVLIVLMVLSAFGALTNPPELAANICAGVQVAGLAGLLAFRRWGFYMLLGNIAFAVTILFVGLDVYGRSTENIIALGRFVWGRVLIAVFAWVIIRKQWEAMGEH